MGQFSTARPQANPRRSEMSTLIHRINAVKTACTLNWLTPSQAQAWRDLHNRLLLGDVVNLYGPPGSGKTFLAWLLVKLDYAIYNPLLTSNPSKAKLLPIVDNYPFTREAYRDLLKRLSFGGYAQAVVLTRVPIHDYCFHVPLALNELDLDHVRQRLLSIDPTLPPRRGGTLHHVINPDLPLDEETL